MTPLLAKVRQGTMNGNGRPTQAATYGVFGLLAIIICGVFGLAALGRDIAQVLYFLGPMVVVLIGLLPIIAGQNKIKESTEANTEKLENIEHQTNGKLDERFREVHDKIETGLTALSNQVALQAGLVNDRADRQDAEEAQRAR